MIWLIGQTWYKAQYGISVNDSPEDLCFKWSPNIHFFLSKDSLFIATTSSSVSSSHDRVTVNQLSIQTHFGHLIRRASSSRRPITVELSGAAANHRRAASRHSQSESWRRRTSTDKVSKMTLNITKVRKVVLPSYFTAFDAAEAGLLASSTSPPM